MREGEARLEKLTRREVREALSEGHFGLAIVATGSIEQHLEHLALEQDIASSAFIAQRVAEKLYPQVLVAAPVSIGIAEHHMHFPGSLSAKPGNWLSVVFDAVESLMRHGIKRVLILNGHGGNIAPAEGVLLQWRLYLTRTQGKPLTTDEGGAAHSHVQYAKALLERDDTGIDLRFHSYWDVIPREFAEEVLETGQYPGHAGEFETSFALYAFPENVRLKAAPHSKDRGVDAATAEKGRLLAESAIDGVAKLVREMLAN